MRHRHHVYWRFDFDVEGSANDVIEQFDDTGSTEPQAVAIVREGESVSATNVVVWYAGHFRHEGRQPCFGLCHRWSARDHALSHSA